MIDLAEVKQQNNLAVSPLVILPYNTALDDISSKSIVSKLYYIEIETFIWVIEQLIKTQ